MAAKILRLSFGIAGNLSRTDMPDMVKSLQRGLRLAKCTTASADTGADKKW